MSYIIIPPIPERNSRPTRQLWLELSPSLLLPLALAGPNTALALYSVFVLAFGLRLLWRPGEPPILFFIFLYQWIQSATGALYGNAVNVPIADLHYYHGWHGLASFLMLTGVLVVALAMRKGAGKPQLDISLKLKALVLAKSFKFWVRIYVITWIFSAACAAIAPMAGGLRLPLLTMSEVKWAGFVLVTFAAFVSPNAASRRLWILIFVIEFAFSIGGFFANFKDVFLFSLFGLSLTGVRLGPRTLIPGALLVGGMLTISLIWTAIKPEYRAIVNAGTGQQVVLLDYESRISELSGLVNNIDGRALQDASDKLFGRLMYHVFFGAAAQTVPTVMPYTMGEIWGEAASRPFMPRLLFPNKRAINDSDLTNKYTGLGLASAEEGASISLGYMAEAYIDFGPILMFLPIIALGVGIGAFYRWLLNQRGYQILVGASLAPFALMPAHMAETSILKMVPSLILTFLASVVIIRFLAPKVLRSLSHEIIRDRS